MKIRFLLVSATTAAVSMVNGSNKSQPNIVVILADDLGYGDVSAYGATTIKTPNLDKLANEGVRFTNGYATSATSTPSRYGMFTGMYPWKNKNAKILPGDAPLIISETQFTWPKMMQQAGYKTAAIGKWHLGMGAGNVNWNKKVSPGANDIGFDYLGEPTPYNEGTPARSSYFGIVDLAGLKKDRFYLYQSKWSNEPVLHVLPHWNWPDRLNQNVPVYCYTNYPKAELFVNGKSMGVKSKDKKNKYTRYRLMWNDVVYQPGEIKVVAYNEKNEAVAEKVIKTAGAPHSIRLTPDQSTIKANGKDLSFVTIEVVDKEGNVCPRADNLLFFEVTGAGALNSVVNGNAIDQTSFGSNYMRAFNGKIVAVIESTVEAGTIQLKVFGGKLQQQTTEIISN